MLNYLFFLSSRLIYALLASNAAVSVSATTATAGATTTAAAAAVTVTGVGVSSGSRMGRVGGQRRGTGEVEKADNHMAISDRGGGDAFAATTDYSADVDNSQNSAQSTLGPRNKKYVLSHLCTTVSEYP